MPARDGRAHAAVCDATRREGPAPRARVRSRVQYGQESGMDSRRRGARRRATGARMLRPASPRVASEGLARCWAPASRCERVQYQERVQLHESRCVARVQYQESALEPCPYKSPVWTGVRHGLVQCQAQHQEPVPDPCPCRTLGGPQCGLRRAASRRGLLAAAPCVASGGRPSTLGSPRSGPASKGLTPRARTHTHTRKHAPARRRRGSPSAAPRPAGL